MKKSSYNVLSSYASSDFALANHKLVITGAPSIDFRKVLTCSGVVAPVAETASAHTLTPTNAASTTFSFMIRQYFPDKGTWVTEQVSHTTAASGSSATTISDAFRAALTALNAAGKLRLASIAGTTTVTFASATGSPLIYLTSLSSGLAVATGTPGVLAVGTYNALAYKGVDTTLITTGHTYASIELMYEEENLVGSAGAPNTVTHTVYFDAGDSDYSTVVTAVKKILASVTSGTTANAEATALANT